MANPQPETERPRTWVLPPAPYALALLAAWWLERRGYGFPLALGAAARPAAWLLVGAGLALFAWTLLTFRRHRTTVNPYKGASVLCTGGPFAYSRNPIYVGDWLIYLGLTAALQSAWTLLFAPLVWAIVRFGVIRHEEAHLEARFGDAYRAYRGRVRRWL